MNRIEAAKHILGMIESVDHQYCEQLEEIEARWLACTNGHIFESYGVSEYSVDTNVLKVSGTNPDERTAYQDHLIPAVARSRDALKAARPEGWDLKITPIKRWKESTSYAAKALGDDHLYSPTLETEELAELHAIIQAWIWVWENANKQEQK